MTSPYHQDEIALQDRLGARLRADAIGQTVLRQIPPSARASFYIYNTQQEVSSLITHLRGLAQFI